MAIGVLGSVMLSRKARGTVTVDDVGVAREIGKRRQMLRWEEMEGFVVSAYGGVTLIPLKAGGGLRFRGFWMTTAGALRRSRRTG